MMSTVWTLNMTLSVPSCEALASILAILRTIRLVISFVSGMPAKIVLVYYR